MTSKITSKGEARNESKNNRYQQLTSSAAVLRTMMIAFVLMIALPSMAQVRLGLRSGITMNKARMGSDMIDSDNRIGYSGGLVLDVNVPILGLGVEASAMYTHRSANNITKGDEVFKSHYIDIPVYARYRLSVPVAERIIAPYAFTGPDFSVLFKDGEPSNSENSKTSVSWNVGAGADLLNHLRLSATYSIGLTRDLNCAQVNCNDGNDRSKDNCWTISLAYMF
ncbi:MAG: PorT family protein [Muribaculaceae bacterium]|nr:PorT family protein [Muribaculaceae bacterium]